MQQEHNVYPHHCFLLSYTIVSVYLFYVTIIARKKSFNISATIQRCLMVKWWGWKVEVFGQRHINLKVITFSPILIGWPTCKGGSSVQATPPISVSLPAKLISCIPNEKKVCLSLLLEQANCPSHGRAHYTLWLSNKIFICSWFPQLRFRSI